MLGKLLATPVNLLLLDEPTNHLDMEACDAMLAAIDNFDGGVIIATHNEMFLHALAKRLIVFQNDGIEVFDGSYQRFLDTVGWNDGHPAPVKPGLNDSNSATIVKQTKKDQRRRRSEIITQRSKIITPLQRQITKIETQIETCEKRLSDLNQSMQLATQKQDGQRIAELSQAMHSCQLDIDRLFDDLQSVTDEFEQQNAAFQKQLDELLSG
jgi:ATP-binding cassette subfamily F protein 3